VRPRHLPPNSTQKVFSTTEWESRFFQVERNDSDTLLAVLCAATEDGWATMTVTESKGLQKGTRVYWRGDAADSGIISETSWDAVTIIWNNGKVASVHHGDMREIQRAPTNSHTANESRPKPAF